MGHIYFSHFGLQMSKLGLFSYFFLLATYLAALMRMAVTHKCISNNKYRTTTNGQV